MPSRISTTKRRSKRSRRHGTLAGAMLNLRTAGWLAQRLWRPAVHLAGGRLRRRRPSHRR